MVVPLWVDTDAGHDDAVALLLAVAHQQFELLGVSAIYGRSTLDIATRSAMSLLAAFHAHIDIQVFPGAEKPIFGTNMRFINGRMNIGQLPTNHNTVGALEGSSLLPPSALARQPDHTAVAAMAEGIQQHPGSLCIICLGPLTNLALLALNYPDLMAHIDTVSVSCGAHDFNLRADTKATEVVFNCPELDGKIILTPSDVASQLLATPRALRQIQRGPMLDKFTVFRQMMYELLTWYADNVQDSAAPPRSAVNPQETDSSNLPSVPLRDPVAVAALLSYLGIDLGITIVQRDRHHLVTHIEAKEIWQLVFDAIDRFETS